MEVLNIRWHEKPTALMEGAPPIQQKHTIRSSSYWCSVVFIVLKSSPQWCGPEGGSEQEQPVSMGANLHSHLPVFGPSNCLNLHTTVIKNQTENLCKLEMHQQSPMCNNNNNTVDDLLPGVFQFLVPFSLFWKKKNQNKPCCDLFSDSVKTAHTSFSLQYMN